VYAGCMPLLTILPNDSAAFASGAHAHFIAHVDVYGFCSAFFADECVHESIYARTKLAKSVSHASCTGMHELGSTF